MVTATLEQPLRAGYHWQRVVKRGRCVLSGEEYRVAPLGGRGPGAVSSLLTSNALIHLPGGDLIFKAGDRVQVELTGLPEVKN